MFDPDFFPSDDDIEFDIEESVADILEHDINLSSYLDSDNAN